MKKSLILLCSLLCLTGCVNLKKNNDIDYHTLIGTWDNVLFAGDTMTVSSMFFYDEERCSQSYDLSVGYEIRSLFNEPCHYEIDGNNIMIKFDNDDNGTGLFEYDEVEEAIYYIDNGERDFKHIKIDNDPCLRKNSLCN